MAVTSEFTQYAINYWQQKTQNRPTTEDVHQIVKNIAGFFEVLQEWQNAEQMPVLAVQKNDGVAA